MATDLQIILRAQNLVSKELKKVRTDMKLLNDEVRKFQGQKPGSGATSLANGFKKASSAGSALTRVLVTLGGIALFANAIKQIAQFDQAMQNVRAVTKGITEQEFAALNEEARRLGASTVFSATEAAQGLEFLARAGFDAREQVAALEGTLNLAAAGGLGLAEAADIASNVLSGFNIDTSEAGRVADVLAATAANSNTSVLQLGEALAFVAPVAAAFGQSIEESSAALGVLGNAGIQASTAGTGLRRVLAVLGTRSDKTSKLLTQLGLTFDEVNPATNSLSDIIERLSNTTLGAGDALDVFGQRGAPAILAIVSQNEDLIELNETVAASQAAFEGAGEAAGQAAIRSNSLTGEIKGLTSAFTELLLQTGTRDDGLLGSLRRLTVIMTGVIRTFAGIQDPLDEDAVLFRRIADAVESLRFVLFALIGLRVLGFLSSLAAGLGTAVTAARTAAIGLTGLNRAFVVLRTTVLGALGPLGWIIGFGLALLAFAKTDAQETVDVLREIEQAVLDVEETVEGFRAADIQVRTIQSQQRLEELRAAAQAAGDAIGEAASVQQGAAFDELSVPGAVSDIDVGEQERIRENALAEIAIEEAKLERLEALRKAALGREAAADKKAADDLAKLVAQQTAAELDALNAKKNFDEAASLAALELAKNTADEIQKIEKAVLDKDLADRTISVKEYYEGLLKLALANLDAEVAVGEAKRSAQIELNRQSDEELDRSATLARLEANTDAELAAINAAFIAQQTTQTLNQEQELLALDNHLKELGVRETQIRAQNSAAATKAIIAAGDKAKAAQDKIDAAELKAQKDKFAREREAIEFAREQTIVGAERRVETGEDSQFELGANIFAANQQAITDLTALREAQIAFNETAKDEDVALSIRNIGVEIENLKEVANVNFEKIKTQAVDDLTGAFTSIIDGTKTAKEAFSDFARSFIAQIAQMILRAIALRAINATLGAVGGAGGGFGSFLGGLGSQGGLFEKKQGTLAFAGGGRVSGKGSSTSDSIPAMVSDGEYVHNAAAVKHYGLNFMEAVNRLKLDVNTKGLPNFAITRPRRMRFAEGGAVTSSGSQTKESSAPPSSLRIINVPDMEAAKEFASSSENEEVVLNIMRRNSGQVKQYLR